MLQFIVQNTIDDQRLDNVTVAVDGDSDLFEAAGEIPAEHIKYGDSANCFTVLRRDGGSSLAPTNFTCELHFTVVQVDPATGEEEGEGFEEEAAGSGGAAPKRRQLTRPSAAGACRRLWG